MPPSARSSWLVDAVDTAIVPAGVALAVGLALAHAIPPRWNTGGAPWATGYPKNVELAAGTAAALSSLVTAVLLGWRFGRILTGIVAAAGYVALALSYPAALPLGAVGLAGAAWLGIGLSHACAQPVIEERTHPSGVWWAVGLAAFLFVITSGPLFVDVYHHGEMLESAVDLVRGGRPFLTYQWPHGASDTGLTALWILITGKIGTSPVVLSMATVFAFGAPAFYLALRRPLGSALATALACWLVIIALWLAPVGLDGGLGLRTCGLLFFAPAAFAAIAARPRPRAALAGVLLAIGFVFRLDAGVYGGLAVYAVLALRGASSPGPWRARVLWTIRHGVTLAAAALATWVVMRLCLGWPGLFFFQYNLETVPRFHTINNGLPYPWPGTAPPLAALPAAVTLLLPIVLLAVAGRSLVRHLRAGDWQNSSPRLDLVVFLAVFSVLALRTPLSRSDVPHVWHWTYFPLLCAIVLCAADKLAAAARPARHAHVLCAGLATALLVVVLAHPNQPLLSLFEHFRPNPPSGACGDTMYTAREAADPRTHRLIAGTCDVEHLLRAHHVARVFFDFGSPWYYVRFGWPPVSPYYALNRAWTPADQAILLGDLRRYDAGALLKVRDFSAVSQYDVHNMFHVPIVEAYLRARRDGAPAVETAIGTLYLWDEPGAPPRVTPGDQPPSEDLLVFVNHAVYDPTSRFLEVLGWAADATQKLPLDALQVAQKNGVAPEVVYGESRPDVAQYVGPLAMHSGFWFVTRIERDELRRGDLGLRLAAADGRERFVPLDRLPLTDLPPLDQVDSKALAVAVTDAEALGIRDRAAALGERGPLIAPRLDRGAPRGESGVDDLRSLQ